MRGWTQHSISKLKVRGVTVQPLSKSRVIIPRPEAPQVVWMHWNLLYWCNEHALQLEKEWRFDKERKYRFDFAIPSLKIGIEYEGIFSEKSRHTTFKGYSQDAEKYNLAAKLGWRVLRYTSANYRQVLQDLEKIVSCHQKNY